MSKNVLGVVRRFGVKVCKFDNPADTQTISISLAATKDFADDRVTYRLTKDSSRVGHRTEHFFGCSNVQSGAFDVCFRAIY